MTASESPRIGVIGGDARIHRQAWPTGYVVQTYTGVDASRLVAAWRAGRLDHIVILTRWVAHGASDTVKRAVPNAITWPRGIPQLAGELPKMFPLRVAASRPPAGTNGTNGARIDLAETVRAACASAWATWSRSVLDLFDEERARKEGWRLPHLLLALGLNAGAPEAASVTLVLERACKEGRIRLDGDRYWPVEAAPTAAEPAPVEVPQTTVACATEEEPVMSEPETPSPAQPVAPAETPAETPPAVAKLIHALDEVPRYLPWTHEWRPVDAEAFAKIAPQHTDGTQLLIEMWLETGIWRKPGQLINRVRYSLDGNGLPLVRSLRQLYNQGVVAAEARSKKEMVDLRAGKLWDYVARDVATKYIGGYAGRLEGLPQVIDRTTNAVCVERKLLVELYANITRDGARDVTRPNIGKRRPARALTPEIRVQRILALIAESPGVHRDLIARATGGDYSDMVAALEGLVRSGAVVAHPGFSGRSRRYTLPGQTLPPYDCRGRWRMRHVSTLAGQRVLLNADPPGPAAVGSLPPAPEPEPVAHATPAPAPVPAVVVTSPPPVVAPGDALRTEIYRAINAGELSTEKGMAMLKALIG